MKNETSLQRFLENLEQTQLSDNHQAIILNNPTDMEDMAYGGYNGRCTNGGDCSGTDNRIKCNNKHICGDKIEP